MLYPNRYEGDIRPKNKLEEDLFASKSGADAFVTAYVSKMFAVSAKELPENKKKHLTADEMRARALQVRAVRDADGGTAPAAVAHVSQADREYPPAISNDAAKEGLGDGAHEILLGFARLYSGTLRRGSSVFAVLPKYTTDLGPTHPRNARHFVTATVEGLYVMMGRELVAVDVVRAGNIFAIKGLEGKVWRNATLCAPGEAEIGETGRENEICLINLGGISRAVRMSCNMCVRF